jgi:hypothetical protein
MNKKKRLILFASLEGKPENQEKSPILFDFGKVPNPSP